MWRLLHIFFEFRSLSSPLDFPSNLSQVRVQLGVTLLLNSEEGLWGIKSSCEVLQWKKMLLYFLNLSMDYAVDCTALFDPDFSRLKREGLDMTVLGRKCGNWYLFHRQKQLCGTTRHPGTHCNCRLQYQAVVQLASLPVNTWSITEKLH